MDQRLPEPIGKFKNTYYYLVSEHKYDDRNEPKDTPMLAEDGSVLVYVKKSFYKAVKIEGSGKLNDGRVINFSSYRDQTYHWAFTKHPVGRGVGNCALVPYKTIAVDPDMIPLGSLVYIDETKGMKLPDGSLHNGYWRADDKGGAIQEKRIDIFVGVDEESGQLLADNGIKHMQALTVRLIQKPEADSCANQDPQ
jgi:3D (Asp-Asp-Asp) domain-containing protein